ncbi:mitochondrial transcription rescue factor 1 [Euwallacea similis]|uniref:mitochondrial transcription rescue factor 1 n=1 Tax=Euwallacea similis TaxID=1736056 RepID=UPI00344CA3E8
MWKLNYSIILNLEMFKNILRLNSNTIRLLKCGQKNYSGMQKSRTPACSMIPDNHFVFSCYGPQIQLVRHKKQSSRRNQNKESETENDDDSEDLSDQFIDKNSKVLYIHVSSMRVDGILKTALGMARAKIEALFYENKIRINGQKIMKKSAVVQKGDEIDLIKGPDLKNPNFINVARVEILSLKPKEESIEIKIRRCKSLNIEAY